MKLKPGANSTIYASTKDYYGTPNIYRTTDGGANWTTITSFSAAEYRIGIAVTAVAIAIPKREFFDEADLSQLPDSERPDKVQHSKED